MNESTAWLYLPEEVVCRVPLAPPVDVPHPEPVSHGPTAHPTPDILGSAGAGMEAGRTWQYNTSTVVSDIVRDI